MTTTIHKGNLTEERASGSDSALTSDVPDTLLVPYRLNSSLSLTNRIVMAPMTRSMADPDLVPTPEMASYYARRADAGLIISEATLIREDTQGYPNTPGIFTDGQINGWRRVTRAVHSKGGRIFLQLFHAGRVSHPFYLNGALPIAPSAVPLSGRVPRTRELEYSTPRALDFEEIPALVASFVRSARNAMAAGFDGVEIHAANGYLVDQFLHWDTNRRTDAYGGSAERMARFALEVIDAVSGEVGSGRLGVRLSPVAHVNIEPYPEDADVFTYLLRELNERALAYIHGGILDDTIEFDFLGGSVSSFLRNHYDGHLVGSGGYTPETASRAIGRGCFDLVAIGRPFLANPDLVRRIRWGRPLEADESMLASLN